MNINHLLALTIFALFNFDCFATEVMILHTNDLHSRFEGNGPDMYFTKKVGDEDPVKGHYARLAQLVKDKEKEYAQKAIVIKLDAGDFFAGTLFHTLAPNTNTELVPEIEFFETVGMDMTTLGNHEFDADEPGLLTMLQKADKNNFKVPIVVSHLTEKGKKKYSRFLENGQLREWLILEREFDSKKIKIGILGGMGPDAIFVSQSKSSQTNFYGFNPKNQKQDIEALQVSLQEKIDLLKEKHKCDLIILSIHAGAPEDETLAQNLKGLDVIVAGHTHKLYEKPKVINNTIIVQAGSYAKFLGGLLLKKESTGWSIHPKNPVYWTVNDKTPVDPEFVKRIEIYKSEIDKVLSWTQMKYSDYLFKTSEKLIRKERSGKKLGTKLTSFLNEELNENELKDHKSDFYFTSQALIRNDLNVPAADTKFQFSDLFKFFSIGFQNQNQIGTKIVSFYLKKTDLKLMVEFLELYKRFKPKFSPAYSKELSFSIRDWGIPIINKVKDLRVHGKEIDDLPELIHISTNQYVASFFPKLKSMTYGLISFETFDKDGKLAPPQEVKGALEFLLLTRRVKNKGWD